MLKEKSLLELRRPWILKKVRIELSEENRPDP
jgi:hypothetical protein